MRDCIYFFKQNPDRTFTYLELVEEVQRIKPSSAIDIVFSRSSRNPVLDEVYRTILAAKRENSALRRLEVVELGDDEPNMTEPGALSCLALIDSNHFTMDNRKLISKMNSDDFINSTVLALKAEGVDEDEAKSIALRLLDIWDSVIGKDAAELHSLLSGFAFNSKGPSDFEDHLRGTRFEDVSGQIYSSMSAFLNNALGQIKARNGNQPSSILNNVNLREKIEGIDLDLFGHIDMVVIDASGDLHLFNYKIATSPIMEGSVKLEKYKYQMALLKQLLAAHGIKVRNATLNIVPIRLNYSSDYSHVDSAVVKESPIEFTRKNGRYVFGKYDKVALHFIKATINTSSINNDDINIATKLVNNLFMERDIGGNGIRMTAQEWIKKNRGCILESNDPEYAYEVDFGEGDTKFIKERSKPEHNQELISEILQRGDTLLDNGSDIIVGQLIKDIKSGISTGHNSFFTDRMYTRCGTYMAKVFSKYFALDSETPSDWEFVENDTLNSAGILLFKHKDGLLDVITVSNFDLDVKANFRRGNTVLGCYKTDNASKSAVNYKSTYGNIEAVRTMLLLNLVLPKIGGEFTLGKLHVISLRNRGQGVPHSIETFNRECFGVVVDQLNSLPETHITNNFSKYKFVDAYDVITQEYNSIILDSKVIESKKLELMETGFGNLASANTIEARLNALRSVESAMRLAYPQLWLGYKALLNDPTYGRVATLYKHVLDAIAYYDVGTVSSVEEKMSDINKNAFISSRIPNRNVLLIVNLYTRSINTIAEKAEERWVPIRKVLYLFYDDIGYSRAQNSLVGGLAKLFEDLYRHDSNGNRELRLLNPYDEYDMAQISEKRNVKLQFLKRILFEFAKVRYPMNGIKFDFTSESDPALQSFIEEHRDTYFNIPLEKASTSTRLLNYSPGKKWEHWKTKTKQLLFNTKDFIKEAMEEDALIDNGNIDSKNIPLEHLQLFNKFQRGEGDGRENFIAEKGKDYFETNLETILADFIERDLEFLEFNKSLVTVKALLFLLDLLGENPNMIPVVKQTKEIIEDYLKYNMFGISTLDATSLKIIAMTAPLRKIVTHTLIGGNVISALRDTFEGIWLNTVRTLNHFLTDISTQSLARAYSTVVSNSFTDGRSINIVGQLCLIYRLSNIDVSRISEGLKSERGVVNFDNWFYATLRRPDFLNRMTLFVARCYLDGVFQAFDIKDGRLVYDWKKDDRFKIFASGNTNRSKYKELMGAYYNAVRAYNQEHPEATISYDPSEGGLPMPYSLKEVEVLKNLANSIYGSYDKSTRAAYERMALGTFFGAFSTWMNGIYANYMTKPGLYANGELLLEPLKDSSGNPLFFANDGSLIVLITDDEGNIKYYYDGTNTEVASENLTHMVPIMDKVPIVVLGIAYTLKDALKAIRNGTFDKDILNDPQQMKNLKKLLSDLLTWLIFGSIYKYALTPGYQEFKKGMKDRDMFTNVAVEILYKSSSRSYDGFRGVYNVWEYLGENTNPPVYTLNVKLVKDALSVAFGDKSAVDALTGSIAPFRAFQDSYRGYKKSLPKED